MDSWSKECDFAEFGAIGIIGKGKKLRKIIKLVDVIAKTEATVLVQGESGTGKEMISKAIQIKSLRAQQPYIKVNCAALSEHLLESELFGYKKGAFTGAFKNKKGLFEMADGGTILLDEIGSMSPNGQRKLLRVIQENEVVPVGDTRPVNVDVRIIATTNVLLEKDVKDGRFRKDLYYRLKVVTIDMPPLREIKEDIQILAEYFLSRYTHKHRSPVKIISPSTMKILNQHDWPGNIRELENTIERAVIMEHTDQIQPYSLPTAMFQKIEAEKEGIYKKLTLRDKVSLYERQVVLSVLNECGWKKSLAAQNLGIDQRNMNYFLKKHHITDPATRLRERGGATS
ncbi:MAG: sigma-54 interaction domain-containing protein [bacterium]